MNDFSKTENFIVDEEMIKQVSEDEKKYISYCMRVITNG